MLSLDILTSFNSDHLWLEFSEREQEEAWQQAQGYSNPASRWQAYLNVLSLNAFLPWLNSMLDGEVSARVYDNNLPEIWEFVNGTAVELPHTQLVLIPQETDDLGEISVPAEWVDISLWAADYYLAVQVNPDERNLRFWGYTSYSTLKDNGYYDPINRVYSLEQEDLEEDLNIILVTDEFCQSEKPVVAPLPELSNSQYQLLLQQLKNITACSPRLAVSFREWGALLANDTWRRELYQSRMPVSLSAWLQQNFQQAMQTGWQSLSEFLSSSQLAITPQFAMRSTTNAIDTIYNSSEDMQLRKAAIELGSLGGDSAEVKEAHREADLASQIAALIHLLQTTQDEETRFCAAESLWLLDPGNVAAGIWRAKSIDLGIELAENNLALVIALLPRSDNQTSIFLRLYPSSNQSILPENLTLQILDETGEVFKEIITRSADNVIQYKFWGQPGEQFSVSICLGKAKITESFVI